MGTNGLRFRRKRTISCATTAHRKAPQVFAGARDPSERRARESNPQPVARHLISSQAANHSHTLRASRRKVRQRRLSGRNGTSNSNVGGRSFQASPHPRQESCKVEMRGGQVLVFEVSPGDVQLAVVTAIGVTPNSLLRGAGEPRHRQGQLARYDCHRRASRTPRAVVGSGGPVRTFCADSGGMRLACRGARNAAIRRACRVDTSFSA